MNGASTAPFVFVALASISAVIAGCGRSPDPAQAFKSHLERATANLKKLNNGKTSDEVSQYYATKFEDLEKAGSLNEQAHRRLLEESTRESIRAHYMAPEIVYDVQKTSSVTTPFAAVVRINWTSDAALGDNGDLLTFGCQEQKWVLTGAVHYLFGKDRDNPTVLAVFND